MIEGPLWPGRWAAEDGGPRRRQMPADGAATGLRIQTGERLALAAVRDAYATTMVVLRAPGEVFVLRHTVGIRAMQDASSAWVERIDPVTLERLAHSSALAGGPFWPGGMAAHANGSLYVVHGCHCHRLSAELDVLASVRLPQERPYNSFVVLADGTLAMKDLDLDLRAPAQLTLLDPDTLAPRCAPVTVPEPSIARLSADGSTLYVIGLRSVWRYHWDGTALNIDDRWQFHYDGGPRHSYGWDGVISGGQLWFLDNGAHDYTTTMRGAGRSSGAVRLHRVALDDAHDHETVDVGGGRHGTVTNPPLYDAARGIAVAYDSGNGLVQAFRFNGETLHPLWRRRLSHAAHMLLFPDTGELVLGDFRGPAVGRTRAARSLGRRSSRPAQSPAVRRALARHSGDDVVILDIETGVERARARVPSMFQSVLFPAPGFGRDIYWCTFSALARLEVQ